MKMQIKYFVFFLSIMFFSFVCGLVELLGKLSYPGWRWSLLITLGLLGLFAYFFSKGRKNDETLELFVNKWQKITVMVTVIVWAASFFAVIFSQTNG